MILRPQTRLNYLTDNDGDTGSWLNMPYFGGESQTDRYALYDGQAI